MKPVFSQEVVPGGENLPVCFVKTQSCQDVSEAVRRMRASFTVCGMAFSLGISGGLFSSADAAVTTKVTVSSSATGVPSIRASYGSDRSVGASAVYHTVAHGETVWAIAQQHGTSVEEIRAMNGISSEQVIRVGQVLRVPPVALAVIQQEAPMLTEAAIPVPDEAVVSVPLEEVTPALVDDEAPFLSEGLASEDLVSLAVPEGTGADLLLPQGEVGQSSEAFTGSAVPQLDSIPWDSTHSSKAMESAKAMTPEDLVTLSVPDGLQVIPEESISGEVTEGVLAETVIAGDTLWSIAQEYGVDPGLLARVNGIDNAALILPGDKLIIPESAAGIERANGSEVLQASEAREVITTDDELDAARSVSVLESTAMIEPAVPSEAVPSEVVTSGNQPTDPYVAGLVAEVTTVTSNARQVASRDGAVATATPEAMLRDETVESNEVEAIGLAVPEVTNPQFPGMVDDADIEEEGRISTFSSEELLAAAPLGSEVYAPIVERPEGRVVSPDMPILPSQDEYLPEAPASTQIDGYLWPAQGVLTSGYGWRWGRMHRGIDVAGPVGTPIFAAAPGVVTRSGWNSGGYGNLVEIRHSDGSMTRYAHNSRLVVESGQQVSQGQKIAEMGSTGYSTGPHLHFEIHLPSQGAVNPMAYLPGR